MNYELAKKLKDAGFPQEGVGYFRFEDGQSDFKKGIGPNPVYIPTLEELIEACGKQRFNEDIERNTCLVVFSVEDTWVAGYFSNVSTLEISSMHEMGSGSIPSEAVANLWLVLSKK